MQRLSKDELLAVLAAARAKRERDWLAFLLAYNHALRRSEVVALTRDDFHDGKIDVRRLKGSEHTVQPLIQNENPLLDEREATLAFIANLHGKQRLFPFSDRHLARLFTGYALAVGISREKAHAHVLKHTGVKKVYDAEGVSVAQTWAGHKSGASTLVYTKPTEEEAAPLAMAALAR